jgi:hypothetical protein
LLQFRQHNMELIDVPELNTPVCTGYMDIMRQIWP